MVVPAGGEHDDVRPEQDVVTHLDEVEVTARAHPHSVADAAGGAGDRRPEIHLQCDTASVQEALVEPLPDPEAVEQRHPSDGFARLLERGHAQAGEDAVAQDVVRSMSGGDPVNERSGQPPMEHRRPCLAKSPIPVTST